MMNLYEVDLHVEGPRTKRGALMWNEWMQAEVQARHATTAIRLAQSAVARRKRKPTKDVTCIRLALRSTAKGTTEKVLSIKG